MTISRANALDQAWQERKAELALEQSQDRKAILSVAAASRGQGNVGAGKDSTISSLAPEDDSEKSPARKQIEEREAALKGNCLTVFSFIYLIMN